MKRSLAIFIVAAFVSVAAFASSAQPRKSPNPAQKPTAIDAQKAVAGVKSQKQPLKPRNELSSAELADIITNSLGSEPGAISMIQSVTEGKGDDEKKLYMYKGKRLKEWDADMLNKLLNVVQNEISKIRTQKLQRQLESVRRANLANMQTQQTANANIQIQQNMRSIQQMNNMQRVVVPPVAAYNPGPPPTAVNTRPPSPPPAPPRR